MQKLKYMLNKKKIYQLNSYVVYIAIISLAPEAKWKNMLESSYVALKNWHGRLKKIFYRILFFCQLLLWSATYVSLKFSLKNRRKRRKERKENQFTANLARNTIEYVCEMELYMILSTLEKTLWWNQLY